MVGENRKRKMDFEPEEKGAVCEICHEKHGDEEFPFQKCWKCGDAPSWHHGRCCPAGKASITPRQNTPDKAGNESSDSLPSFSADVTGAAARGLLPDDDSPKASLAASIETTRPFASMREQVQKLETSRTPP